MPVIVATELEKAVSDNLIIPQDQFYFYTNSRIVLGYIRNRILTDFINVQNRVRKFNKV